MGNSDLIEIGSYPNAAQAEIVRLFLSDNGVEACVSGASSNTMLSYIGSALGGVRVLVRQADVAAATSVLELVLDSQQLPGAQWFCGRCKVEVDAGFELCWSCGEARSQVEERLPEIPDGRDLAQPQQSADAPAARHLDGGPVVDESNPYAALVAVAAQSSGDGEQAISADERAEARLVSGWRAAVIGLAIFPFSVYSMYQLLRAGMVASRLSDSGMRRFYAALFLNAISALLWGGVLASATGVY